MLKKIGKDAGVKRKFIVFFFSYSTIKSHLIPCCEALITTFGFFVNCLFTFLFHFSGAPKLVPKCPPEIQEKLDHFGFKRHQVEIITDPSKIRKKRIYTEVEYCHKLGKPPMKKSRVISIEEPALDVPPVETVSNLMIYFLY